MRSPVSRLRLNSAGNFEFENANKTVIPLTYTRSDYWVHTDIKYFDQIWDHISGLYSDLSKSPKDKKPLIMSQISWWYYQSMPYCAGSAGIGNGLLQSLFDYSGVRNSPYKENVAPDLEAFVTPLPTYAKNFPSFFVKGLD